MDTDVLFLPDRGIENNMRGKLSLNSSEKNCMFNDCCYICTVRNIECGFLIYYFLFME